MLCATCRQFHRTAAERYKETLEKERSLWDAERTQMLQDAQVRVVAHFHIPYGGTLTQVAVYASLNTLLPFGEFVVA
jgi:hypothetical protein